MSAPCPRVSIPVLTGGLGSTDVSARASTERGCRCPPNSAAAWARISSGARPACTAGTRRAAWGTVRASREVSVHLSPEALCRARCSMNGRVERDVGGHTHDEIDLRAAQGYRHVVFSLNYLDCSIQLAARYARDGATTLVVTERFEHRRDTIIRGAMVGHLSLEHGTFSFSMAQRGIGPRQRTSDGWGWCMCRHRQDMIKRS